MSYYVISKPFLDWTKEFAPDIIYVTVSTRDAILFVEKLHKLLKIPLVIHMMDDWPTYIEQESMVLRKFWNRKIDKEFRTLLESASLLLCISDLMAKEYKIRYEKDFIPFHNPINVDTWKSFQKKTYQLSDNPTIVYAGRTGIGIQDSLKSVAQAVEIVNTDLKTNLNFILQTREEIPWVENFPSTIHRQMMEYEKLPKVFSEADMLLLPYDFSKSSIKFIRFSMPTKASEFMITGTPIILYAPDNIALVNYARRFNCALIINSPEVNTLAENIKYLIQSRSKREEIGKNAANLAEKNHDVRKVSSDFQMLICSIKVGNHK